MDKIKKRVHLLFNLIFIGAVLISCANEEAGLINEETSLIEEDNNLNKVKTSLIDEETNIKEEEVIPVDEVIIEDSHDISFRDIPSVELVKDLKIGWNLGNTLDATGGGTSVKSETSWGNPITNEDIIKKVKEAGFNVIRIPVSWEHHLGPEPEYLIQTEWLDRVNEVVDYAIDNDLYVILNMHHEEWHFPSYDNLDKARKILTLVWTQIAQRFEDYNEYLIFEGMNEPRMKGTNLEWVGGNEEARDVINQLNKSFVDTIRKAGGNNQNRHLMIPTYAASSDPNTWKDFIIPKDDKVIISIHAYTPYNFALNKQGTTNWSKESSRDTLEIDNLMNSIYNSFIKNGYPVIIGEFGAMDKDNLESRVMWAKYYIQKATDIGIPCIWWDNGAFTGDGELFGLLNRREEVWQYPEVIAALMSGLE